MPDNLRRLAERRDRDRARRHRVTDEPILPDVNPSGRRWSCVQCWRDYPAMRPGPGVARALYSPEGQCKACGGRLVEV